MNEPISLTFKDTPLKDVITDLQMMTGVNIIPDRAALQEANISLDMPLTLPVEKISLRSALRILLDQLKLTYVIKDQVLQITTKEKARGDTITKTYSIADLVVPIENHPTPGHGRHQHRSGPASRRRLGHIQRDLVAIHDAHVVAQRLAGQLAEQRRRLDLRHELERRQRPEHGAPRGHRARPFKTCSST